MSAKRDREARLRIAASRLAAPSLPGISRQSVGAILAQEAARPLRGRNDDLQHAGLFGDAMRQRELEL